jgi:hypothetical protein
VKNVQKDRLLTMLTMLTMLTIEKDIDRPAGFARSALPRGLVLRGHPSFEPRDGVNRVHGVRRNEDSGGDANTLNMVNTKAATNNGVNADRALRLRRSPSQGNAVGSIDDSRVTAMGVNADDTDNASRMLERGVDSVARDKYGMTGGRQLCCTDNEREE